VFAVLNGSGAPLWTRPQTPVSLKSTSEFESVGQPRPLRGASRPGDCSGQMSILLRNRSSSLGSRGIQSTIVTGTKPVYCSDPALAWKRSQVVSGPAARKRTG
jgi:hypothetical protein